jgi:hypothetical protein
VKSIRNLKLMKVGFMALAFCLAASQGKAQGTYKGTFTLPFEARWGTAILQPGDYTISMELESARTFNYLVVRGEGKSAFILANVTDHTEFSKHSQLTLVQTGSGYVVQTLDAGELGLTLSYAVPKDKRQPAALEAELHSQLKLAVSLAGI